MIEDHKKLLAAISRAEEIARGLFDRGAALSATVQRLRREKAVIEARLKHYAAQPKPAAKSETAKQED